MSKLVLQLVVWNGAHYLPHHLASLRTQSFRDWELVVIDNGSTDSSPRVLEEQLAEFSQQTRLICNRENRGFSGGHNQAFVSAESEYVQLLNQDTVLDPSYLERLVAFLEARDDVAAVQGALLRWDFERNVQTDVIDTLGLKMCRSRRVCELSTGHQLSTISSHGAPSREIFGVSGALPMYRRTSVIAVASGGALFDEAYGSYKEDIDLAWRLRGAGWRAFVIPTACAWHDRTADAGKRRRSRSPMERRLSYRNHLMTIIKNEQWRTFRRDWRPIVWYEMRKLGYACMCEWGTLRGFFEVLYALPRLLRQRRTILARATAPPEVMRRWFV
ncbi:MAG: glycosyltransferase family 2 protein [Candidatus Uhrbacteria bacterium]